jgi:hypothetical protein
MRTRITQAGIEKLVLTALAAVTVMTFGALFHAVLNIQAIA